MNHLKTYNIFEKEINEDFNVYPWSGVGPDNIYGRHDVIHSPEVVDIIKDRLTGLSDDGFNIDIKTGYKVVRSKLPSHVKEIVVRIKNHDSLFSIKEVLDDIVALSSHINNEYTLSIDISFGQKYLPIPKLFAESYIDRLKKMFDSNVVGIELTFHKRRIIKPD